MFRWAIILGRNGSIKVRPIHRKHLTSEPVDFMPPPSPSRPTAVDHSVIGRTDSTHEFEDKAERGYSSQYTLSAVRKSSPVAPHSGADTIGHSQLASSESESYAACGAHRPSVLDPAFSRAHCVHAAASRECPSLATDGSTKRPCSVILECDEAHQYLVMRKLRRREKKNHRKQGGRNGRRDTFKYISVLDREDMRRIRWEVWIMNSVYNVRDRGGVGMFQPSEAGGGVYDMEVI